MSELRRGNLDNISLDRLVRCLSRLSREVEFTTRRVGGITVPHWKVDGRAR